MKRLFVTFTLFACAFTSTGFAAVGKIPASIMQSFYEKFNNAKNVTWAEVDGMVRIGFKMDETVNFAYYNEAGDLVVLTKEITFSQLPPSLQSDLGKRFSEYTVSDMYWFQNDEKKEYYVVLENSEKKLILNATSKKWRYFKTSKK